MSELLFIGTSDAFGAGGRRQSAMLLRTEGGSAIVDCGMTTGTGLAELGVDRNEIDAILISHFHGDHYGGIPTLLLAMQYEDARKETLRIAGPAGIETRVRTLATAMGYAFEEQDWTFGIEFLELQAGRTEAIGHLEVRAFETRHQPHTCPHGLVIRDGALKVAYSGDTGWFDDLPRQVGESDLFVSECTYHTNVFDLHLNHGQLVEHRDDFACGRVILTHLGSEMAGRRGAVEFDTADDGLILQL